MNPGPSVIRNDEVVVEVIGDPRENASVAYVQEHELRIIGHAVAFVRRVEICGVVPGDRASDVRPVIVAVPIAGAGHIVIDDYLPLVMVDRVVRKPLARIVEVAHVGIDARVPDRNELTRAIHTRVPKRRVILLIGLNDPPRLVIVQLKRRPLLDPFNGLDPGNESDELTYLGRRHA